jgi:hypothetical protein
MGFPDSFTFDLKNIRIALVIRMIGNAVPVPLAKALGDELLETLFEQWLRDGKAIKEKCSVNKVKEAIVSSDRDVEDQKVETTSSSKKEGTVNNPINLDDDDDEDDGGG